MSEQTTDRAFCVPPFPFVIQPRDRKIDLDVVQIKRNLNTGTGPYEVREECKIVWREAGKVWQRTTIVTEPLPLFGTKEKRMAAITLKNTGSLVVKMVGVGIIAWMVWGDSLGFVALALIAVAEVYDRVRAS